jgi:transcriptional regulator GlxA family with amidase domain
MIVSFVSPWVDLGSNGGQKISLNRACLAEARTCADLTDATTEVQTAAFHALCFRLLGAEAFAEINHTAGSEPTRDGGNWMVAELERVMQANLGNPLGIADMASMVHASRATLGRLFRKHRGVSPAAQFRRLRLDHGKVLLRTTARSITEIAMETGFSSSQHFATAFRQHFGQSPSAMR